jgi:hypothetical protein
MKPTHLLISIEYLQRTIERCSEIINKHSAPNCIGELVLKSNYEYLLKEYKQISLSEEDIEKKANKYSQIYAESGHQSVVKDTYSQALKDFLQ